MVTLRRLALLGGESSGKTSLAQALAQALGTRWVPEYGRQRWEALRRTLTVDELVIVARTQVALEDAAAADGPAGAEWLVCDTTPLTTLQYCLYDHGWAPPALMALAQRDYGLLVVCAPDFHFVQDGARRDEAFRAAQHAWTLDRLTAMHRTWLNVGGSLAQRVAAVLRQLGA